MNISNAQALQQKQKQQLMLNKTQLQKLQVLRMPMYELSAYIQQQMNDNPLLDLYDANYPDNAIDVQSIIDAEDNGSTTTDYEHSFDYHDNCHYGTHNDDYYSSNISAGKPTFRDMLYEQLTVLNMDAEMQDICGYLIQCLDRRGYLSEDIYILAQESGLDSDSLTQAMYILQSLQPAGVAARSLCECLILQLFDIEQLNKYSIKLVREGLKYLAQNNINAISALLGLSKRDTIEYCNLIRSLNPIPSAGYDTGEESGEIIPDAYISQDVDGFNVVMNSSFAPRLTINREYSVLLNQAEQVSSNLSGYITKQTDEANALIVSVKERESTLARIIRYTLSKQEFYYTTGTGLQPMTMQAAAEELGLHVSTVSRAAQDKFIVCVAGTIPLKRLFSKGVEVEAGVELSPSHIKERIKACIHAENKNSPLSDEDIRLALKMLNIDIARRTVAKYRESMGISSSKLRRKFD